MFEEQVYPVPLIWTFASSFERTAAVAQWVKALAPQAERWVLESESWQT